MGVCGAQLWIHSFGIRGGGLHFCGLDWLWIVVACKRKGKEGEGGRFVPRRGAGAG